MQSLFYRTETTIISGMFLATELSKYTSQSCRSLKYPISQENSRGTSEGPAGCSIEAGSAEAAQATDITAGKLGNIKAIEDKSITPKVHYFKTLINNLDLAFSWKSKLLL